MDGGVFVGHKGCNDLDAGRRRESVPPSLAGRRLDQTLGRRARPTGEPMNKRFAYLIIASMVLGVAVGWACNQYLDPAQTAEAVKWFKMGTDLFLRLIKMIIAPLVFSTLVAGIAHMGDAAEALMNQPMVLAPIRPTAAASSM